MPEKSGRESLKLAFFFSFVFFIFFVSVFVFALFIYYFNLISSFLNV